MQKEISPKIIAITFGVLVISFAIAFYVVAWTEPGQAPPGGNVATPLNVGSTGQSKAGGLILNTGGAEYGLIVNGFFKIPAVISNPNSSSLWIDADADRSFLNQNAYYSTSTGGWKRFSGSYNSLGLWLDTNNGLVLKYASSTDGGSGDNSAVSWTELMKVGADGNVSAKSITVIGGAVLPICNSSYRGKQFLLQSGSGVDDGLYVCKKKKDDSYAWTALASPSEYEACAKLSSVKPYVPSTPGAKRFFQTEAQWNGNLGGLSGADTKCQTEAGAKGYSGVWKALLGDTATKGIDRINEAIFIKPESVLSEGVSCYEVIAKDKNDLVRNESVRVPFTGGAWAQNLSSIMSPCLYGLGVNTEIPGTCAAYGCEFGTGICWSNPNVHVYYNACRDWTYSDSGGGNFGCTYEDGTHLSDIERGMMSPINYQPIGGGHTVLEGGGTCYVGCNSLGSLFCVEQ